MGSKAFRRPCVRTVLQFESLRAGGEDVVLAERLQHRRAHDQRVLAVKDEAERERGKDHVAHAVDEDLPPGGIAEDRGSDP